MRCKVTIKRVGGVVGVGVWEVRRVGVVRKVGRVGGGGGGKG